MKFHTCGIHKENTKGSAKLQVTFDEDYNLPDYKPDISAIIMKQGSVSIDEVKVTKGHVWVKGVIKFDVLYRAEQNSLGFCSTSGSITFQENIVMDAAEEFDSASVEHVLEDLTVHITNSRKLAIRGLILLKITLSAFEDVEVPCKVEDASGVEVLTSTLSYLQLQEVGRDQCRVHEELELPGNKLNVQAVIWKELRMEDTSITPLDGGLLVKGELSVFCLYQAEPGIRMEWYEHRLPIQCRMDAAAAEVGGICYAKILDNDWSLSVSNDSEGEMRMLCIDGVIKVEYRLYQEKETDVIKLAKKWIDKYFNGEKPTLKELPIEFIGSEFRKQVWMILTEIPYGKVIAYGDIAKRIAEQKGIEAMSAQAVGGAVGHNPISIIVPCHRVVGANGSLTGYSGGVEVKTKLLELEGVDMSKLYIPTKGTAL